MPTDPSATAAFERQTAIVDSLPHACTMARLENWRIAADEFVRYLNNRGYDVVKVAAVTEPATAARWWQVRRRWRECREAFDAEQDALLLESIQKAATDRGLGPEHVEKALALHAELTRKRGQR